MLDLPGAGARLGPAAPHLSDSLRQDRRAMPEYLSRAAVGDQHGVEPRLFTMVTAAARADPEPTQQVTSRTVLNSSGSR